MTIGGKQVSILVFLNSLMGAILLAGGAITTYAGTLGQEKWVSAIITGLGVVQLVVTNYTHETTSSSGPVAHA
jgi:hypothetical protein